MEIYSYPQLDEQIQAAVLPNGLRIYCVPRADSEKTFAMLAADFGSIDCHFTIDGQTHDVTPGIAHFLEHKLFEEQDGNALQKFAARGAHPNAFTSHIMTAYHFTCTDRFYEDLEILLRFVTTPYFTDENVAKEKGIIGQEIDMLEDTPGWSAYVGVLQALYAVHPVRISVAGSKQSIASLDPDVLRLCHRGFYSPKNLVLVVCGQYAFDRVVELAQRITPAEAAEIASRTYGVEPEAVAQPRWERKMAVSRPMFMVGCKDQAPRDMYRQQLVGELAAQCIGGKSTVLYDTLYKRGLADRTFDPDYFTFAGGACALFSGESSEPDAVREALEQEIQRVAAEGLDEAVFRRSKKALYGKYIRRSSDASGVCRMQAEAVFSGAMAFDFAEVFQNITKQEVAARVQAWAQPNRMAMAVVAPQTEG